MLCRQRRNNVLVVKVVIINHLFKMSNIHTLFDGKKDEENKKNTTAYNGNGVASISRDAMGLDGIVS